MKFCASAVVALVVALAADAGAFTASPSSAARRRRQPRATTSPSSSSLAITTLDEWQLLDNGSVVGSVRGHPTLSDGDVITTSPLSRPDAARNNNLVTTLTGSQYKLGSPVRSRGNGGGGGAVADEPGFGRSKFVTGLGTASLFAGGVALGVEVGGFVKPAMTIPEVSGLGTFRSCLYGSGSSSPTWMHAARPNSSSKLHPLAFLFPRHARCNFTSPPHPHSPLSPLHPPHPTTN